MAIVLAVIGTGRMGAAMVGILRRAGEPVTVYDRTLSRADEVAAPVGAAVAETPREAALDARTVIVSVSDDAAARSVYSGPDGLVAGLRAGTVVMETSTLSPGTVRDLAGPVAERGAALLDAPVSGSVPLVERGELTFMIGGSAEAVDAVRPVLDVLGKQVFHLGEQGAGATMKLALNAALHGLNQAIAEALVLAEKAGVYRSTAYAVFAASALAAPFVHYKRPAYEHPGEQPAAFTLDLVAKDLALATDLAAEVGAHLPQLAANRETVAAALAAGLGEADMSALAVLFRDR